MATKTSKVTAKKGTAAKTRKPAAKKGTKAKPKKVVRKRGTVKFGIWRSTLSPNDDGRGYDGIDTGWFPVLFADKDVASAWLEVFAAMSAKACTFSLSFSDSADTYDVMLCDDEQAEVDSVDAEKNWYRQTLSVKEYDGSDDLSVTTNAPFEEEVPTEWGQKIGAFIFPGWGDWLGDEDMMSQLSLRTAMCLNDNDYCTYGWPTEDAPASKAANAQEPPSAQGQPDWKYEIHGKTVEITGASKAKSNGDVVIPSTLKGYPVTSIAEGSMFSDGAFGNCKWLKSVTIPDSMTVIGWTTFAGCSKLTTVVIPNGVKEIRDGAFANCKALKNVKIPDSVTRIGDEAFGECDLLFDKQTIPGLSLVDGWIVGSEDSLSGNLNLTGVRGIGGGAFEGCIGLTSVTIPNGMTCIGDSTFKGCSGLTSVTIPDSVTSIGDSVFLGCNLLFDKQTIPGLSLVDGWVVGSENSFSGNLNHTGVRGICGGAFEGCTGLTGVTIPDGMTCIGDTTFKGCSGLTSVTIPDGVTSIGVGAFEGCSGLTGVTIPDGVTRIGDSAFAYCRGLTNVTIPASVTSIGDSAFVGCSGLTSVTVPSDAKIDDYAFDEDVEIEIIRR